MMFAKTFPRAVSATRQLAIATEAPARPHLTFLIDGQPYACPIGQVQHLLRLVDAKTHEHAGECAPWETGTCLELAGGDSVPIVSLRQLWGLPLIQQGAGDRQALLISNVQGQRIAFLVDACLCVLPRLPGKAHFQVPAALKGARGVALKTATIWDKSLLVTIDLERLLPGKPIQGESLPNSCTTCL